MLPGLLFSVPMKQSPMPKLLEREKDSPLLNVSSRLGHHRREALVASMGRQVLMEMPVCFSFKKKKVYDQERLWD